MLLFFLICWVVFCVHALAGYPLAGYLRLNLYHLYGLAASGGWLLGNLAVGRERRFERQGGDPLPPATRRRLFFLELLAPGGALFLLWSLAPKPIRIGVPMAPIYATGVFVLFFLVPVSLKRVFGPK
ncbi:MAG: hypothetical protein GY769_15420 [bacterium]|nr:hypothetical protein [bacterium]